MHNNVFEIDSIRNQYLLITRKQLNHAVSMEKSKVIKDLAISFKFMLSNALYIDSLN